MNMLSFAKNNYYSIILHVVVVLLGVEVYLLSDKVKTLTGSNEETVQLKEGEDMVFGELEYISTPYQVDTTKQINVFIFSTTCPFCQTNVKKWNYIDSIGRHNKNFESIGICTNKDGNLEEFIAKYKPNFPIAVSKDAQAFKNINKMSVVPVTLIRNDSLKLTKLWIGALNSDHIAEINSINSALN